jgi:hypothetical protein
MARSLSTPWPTGPRSVFFDDVASRPVLARAVQAGRIRRLAPRVYTADLVSLPSEIIVENRWPVLARVLPDAVIADRSAAADGRVVSGRLFVVSDLPRRSIRLPGLEIRVRPGMPIEAPVPDLPWADGLRMSSPARILLDNLAESRSRSGKAGRTLSLPELEDWLARKSLAWGAERLERLRLDTVALAEALGATRRLDVVERLFDQVSGRLPPRPQAGPLLVALTRGRAWDERRVVMFDRAARDAARLAPSLVPEWLPPAETPGELPFYESYFSNYIEGTEFTIDEARRIVETQRPPPARPADGHDILGTYRCVSDPVGRSTTSDDPDELVGYLIDRHRTILAGRPDQEPGCWKTEANRVGAYDFVAPEQVEGTLRKGLALVSNVPSGIGRALFLMFVVLEVHPFGDGNGRVARVMMNAELSAAGASRIVIPSVYRDEYVSGLRRASVNDGDLSGLVRVMAHAWRWTAAMPWADRAAVEGQLEATHALQDPIIAREEGLRLDLP